MYKSKAVAYVQKQRALHNELGGVGTPNLADWLAVLGDKVKKVNYQTHNGRFAAYIKPGVAFYFDDLGDPAYEADYKVICELLGI